MGVKNFKLPDPGEGLLEAEIVEWKVAVGDTVKVNDIVVEVETAKSLVELPIPWAGTVAGLLVQVGQEVAVGTPIIAIDDGLGDAGGAGDGPAAAGAAAPSASASDAGGADGDDGEVKLLVGSGPKAEGTVRRARKATRVKPEITTDVTPASAWQERGLPVDNKDEWRPAPQAVAGEVVDRTPRASAPRAAVSPPATTAATTAAIPGGAPDSATVSRALAKPPVRKLAKDLGIDLGSVVGTGAGGVVTREDLTAQRADGQSAAGTARPAGMAGAAGTVNARGETRIPIKGVRKMTAQAMVGSAFTAPHVTEWITVDVTATMELVDRLRADREFRDVKVTPLLVLARAMCLAVRRNPQINATWDEAAQEIAVRHYVNLGIAAATPRGLIVPNIKDADLLNMRELADELAALTATAREGRTPPADMAGGTITITNVGVFGVDTGTPILNPGEAAIVAFGAIRKQPWVVTDASGADVLAIRHVTTIGLSFDHRLVDGELGSRYLADVAAIMADPARALVWG